MSASTLRIPNYVKARSAKALRAEMLKVNATAGMQFEWFSIQWQPEEKVWYAWYMNITDVNFITGEIVDG